LKFILFITKPYSVSVLEPVAAYLSTKENMDYRWVKAKSALRCNVPGPVLPFEDVPGFDPDAILVPGNVVPYDWPGLKVQIFHGLGEEKQGHYRITGFFDLYCTPGPHMTAIFEGLQRRHGHFLVRETGWSKLDSLNLTDQRAERKKSLGLDPEKPVLLYAPTFSPKLTSAPALFSEIELLQSRDYQWICKFHSLMDAQTTARYRSLESPSFQIAETDTILPLMEAADILITDTSSVAYEFLFLDRPIITYRARARQEKGLDITSPDDLEGAIVRSLLDPQEFSPVRHEILEELHPYKDGQSSQRVVEAIRDVLSSGELDTLRPKPSNRFRKWQLRRLFP